MSHCSAVDTRSSLPSTRSIQPQFPPIDEKLRSSLYSSIEVPPAPMSSQLLFRGKLNFAVVVRGRHGDDLLLVIFVIFVDLLLVIFVIFVDLLVVGGVVVGRSLKSNARYTP